MEVKSKCPVSQFHYKLFHCPLSVLLSQEKGWTSSPSSGLLRIQISKCAVQWGGPEPIYSKAAEPGLLWLGCHRGAALLKFKFWSFSDSSKFEKKISVHKKVTKITKQNSPYSENKNLGHFLLSSLVQGKIKEKKRKSLANRVPKKKGKIQQDLCHLHFDLRATFTFSRLRKLQSLAAYMSILPLSI